MPELRDDILPEDIEKLALEGWTVKDMADLYACHPDTIRSRFRENLTKGRAKRRGLLRDYQWEAARKGNPTVLVWLGKQELGQSDYGPAVDEDEQAPFTE